MTSSALARASRWAVLAAAVLMGAALLATVWSTHRAVSGASEMLVRGQGTQLQEAVRLHVAAIDGLPTSADLADILAELEPDGARYIAALDQRDRVIAEAGTPAGAGDAHRERIVLRRPLRRAFRRAPRRGAPRPGALVVEYDPRVADELSGSARGTLAIGALAAGAFLVLAMVLFRRQLQREALERRLEQGRRLASLGQMSAVLAHELRNPLASLKGNAQLLARALPEGERTRAKADRVVDEAIRLERLTDELLEFARTGSIQRAPIDPAQLLRDAAGAPRDGVDIAVDAADAPGTWSLDAERMRRVLDNLFDNARESGTASVEARVAREDGALAIVVRDHGPGLAEEDLARVFEPFFSRRTQGTGLGLAVCKRIVELHGGSITASNAPGGGAEFRILIPGE